MIVREIMSSDPYVADVRWTVRRVARALMDADVRHLPIVNEGALVGIVSDRDLHGVIPSPWDEVEDRAKARAALEQPISTVMSSDVVSVDPESDVVEVIDLMIEHKVGAIPVVEADSSKLVGIVSYVDALRAVRDAL